MSEEEIETRREQLRLLDTLDAGRGRHAPMAMICESGGVNVYRGGRRDTSFSIATCEQCRAAGWVKILPPGRYAITPAGRVHHGKDR